MATSFDTINDKFLHLLEGLDLMDMTDDDLMDELYHYMDYGISLYFNNRYCRVDLTDISLVDSEFNVDLNRNEINIIAMSMLMAWMEKQINTLENMKQKVGTRDFKPSSSQIHLDKLMKRKNDVKKDLKSFIREYSDRYFEGYD